MKVSHRWRSHALAVLCVAAAVAVRLALVPVMPSGYPFITIFAAVAAAGRYGGFGPGLLAVGLGGVAGWLLHVPLGAAGEGSAAVPTSVAIATLTNIVIVVLAARERNARLRAEALAASTLERDRAHRAAERRFRALSDSAPVAICVRQGGRCVYVNPAFLRIFRCASLDDAIGHDAIEFIAPAARAMVEDYGARRQAGEDVPTTYETVGRRRDGAEFPLQIDVALIEYDGQPAVLTHGTDLTGRPMAENRLRFLSRATAALSATFQAEHALGDTLRLAVPELASWAAAELVDGSGSRRRVASMPAGSEDREPDLTVPIVAGGRVLGTLLFAGPGGPGARFAAEDVALFEEVGRRAGVAVANATLHRAEQAAREAAAASEARLRSVVESNMLGIAFWQGDRVIQGNSAFLGMLGYSKADVDAGLLRGERLSAPGYADADRQAMEEVERSGSCTPYEKEFLRSDGSRLPVLVGGSILPDRTGVFFMLDLTERRRAQEQLQAAQRLEMVGRLAGGVAHESNNALQAIIGFAAFAIRSLAPDDPARRDVEEVQRAAERAAQITRQLLAFSRRQVLRPIALELHEVLEESARLLAQALGPERSLVIETPARPAVAFADRGQLEQVLLNLALNARDAMPGAGTLTLRILQAPPSGFVGFAVTDDGAGMDAATRARVFEPFFTTKQPGRGTGLGLSVVHGIVEQSGGRIEVDSAPGKGTTMTVLLPAAAGPVESAPQAAASTPAGGSETILVVDDEAVIRALAVRCLVESGYRTIEADDGAAALELCARMAAEGRAIDLVITDVVMRGMDGLALGREIAGRGRDGRLPRTPVLYTSGHPGEEMVERGELERDAPFLQKPFQPAELAALARRLLDARRAALPAAPVRAAL